MLLRPLKPIRAALRIGRRERIFANTFSPFVSTDVVGLKEKPRESLSSTRMRRLSAGLAAIYSAICLRSSSVNRYPAGTLHSLFSRVSEKSPPVSDGTFSTSEITSPSASSIIRSAYFSEYSRSWDTMMTSLVSESFLNVSNTCLPVALSSAPVGSSAKMILGFLTSARAIATRCSCPPESSFGRRLAYPARSTSARIFSISFSSARRPCSSMASAMLAPTLNSFKTLYS